MTTRRVLRTGLYSLCSMSCTEPQSDFNQYSMLIVPKGAARTEVSPRAPYSVLSREPRGKCMNRLLSHSLASCAAISISPGPNSFEASRTAATPLRCLETRWTASPVFLGDGRRRDVGREVCTSLAAPSMLVRRDSRSRSLCDPGWYCTLLAWRGRMEVCREGQRKADEDARSSSALDPSSSTGPRYGSRVSGRSTALLGCTQRTLNCSSRPSVRGSSRSGPGSRETSLRLAQPLAYYL